MRLPVQSVADLGLAIRATRRESGVRIDDLAALASVSKQFLSDVEYGKPTVQLGRVLQVLAELGLKLEVDLPPGAADELARLKAAGGLPPRARRGGRTGAVDTTTATGPTAGHDGDGSATNPAANPAGDGSTATA